MRPAHLIIAILFHCFCDIGCAEASPDETCAPHDMAVGTVTVMPATLAGVPAILRIPGVASFPPILLWHGFGAPNSSKDLMASLPLDDVPSVKVYLELPLFGTRGATGTARSLAQRQAEDYITELFEPAILGAAAELPRVVEDLRARRCMGMTEGVGLFGFSAGGDAVLYALAQHGVDVRAAVIVNTPINLDQTIAAVEKATGHPYIWTPKSKRIAQRFDAVRRAVDIASSNPPPALLVLQGDNDVVIRPEGAINLRDALAPRYRAKGAKQRLRVTILHGVSHSWTDSPALDTLRRESGDWFNAHMQAATR